MFFYLNLARLASFYGVPLEYSDSEYILPSSGDGIESGFPVDICAYDEEFSLSKACYGENYVSSDENLHSIIEDLRIEEKNNEDEPQDEVAQDGDPQDAEHDIVSVKEEAVVSEQIPISSQGEFFSPEPSTSLDKKDPPQVPIKLRTGKEGSKKQKMSVYDSIRRSLSFSDSDDSVVEFGVKESRRSLQRQAGHEERDEKETTTSNLPNSCAFSVAERIKAYQEHVKSKQQEKFGRLKFVPSGGLTSRFEESDH